MCEVCGKDHRVNECPSEAAIGKTDGMPAMPQVINVEDQNFEGFNKNKKTKRSSLKVKDRSGFVSHAQLP